MVIEDNNSLEVIEQREVLGKQFKIYGTKENPLFLAKDVAIWIEHKRARDMIQVVDEEERVRLITATSGGDQEMWFLTEDGLYEVLMQSRKPIAKQFKKEVKKILKQIRTTGGAVRDEEEFIKNYFPSFSDEVKQAMVLDLKHQNQKIQKELENKNKFIKQIAVSENSLLVRDVAKLASKDGLIIGEKKLWEKLREWKLIIQNSTKPMQSGIDRGYFEVIEGCKQHSTGFFTYQTTRVTGKGQVYIINRLLKESEKVLN